jgi:hypothetical protein
LQGEEPPGRFSIKLVVHAGTKKSSPRLEVFASGETIMRYAGRQDAVVAEIVVETFNLGADAIEERVFDATADGPACFDGRSARE